MKSRVTFSVLSAIVLLFTMAYADVPRMINYQGKLTTPQGALIDTTISMTFAIYADSVGTDSLWSEIQSSVVIEKGIFSVLLGSVNPIPDSVFTGGIRYLGVKAGDDSEMTPRRAIVSVGYAYHSEYADSAEHTRTSIPSGVIVMWSGSYNDIPSGWHLCDGTNGTPDLRNVFVYGVNTEYGPDNDGDLGTTDGSTYHIHDYSCVPKHSHQIDDPGHAHGTYAFSMNTSGITTAHISTFSSSQASTFSNTTGITILPEGYENCQTDSTLALPPYYRVAFIMKL